MTTLGEIFPPAEDDGCEPYRQIAKQLGCNEFQVSDAFAGLGVPEWTTPQHLSLLKVSATVLNDAARHAENLNRALCKLSETDLDDLIIAGCVTRFQIEHLRKTLHDDATRILRWADEYNRAGGRNPAAYIVAEGMRRLFRRLRKKITYGLGNDGAPSTEFGRAVKLAIGEFGIRADWRGPASKAFDKHASIQRRLMRCVLHKHQMSLDNTNSP